MRTSITITNMHPRGFAFGVTDDGGQIFIPPHIATEHTIDGGDKIEALLTINPSASQRERTPWLAVRLYPDGEDAPAPVEIAVPIVHIEDRDEAIYKLICEGSYMTTGELAEHSGLDPKTAGNSANRLFNAGRIAKADVYNRVGQARASFTLWAEKASNFIEG